MSDLKFSEPRPSKPENPVLPWLILPSYGLIGLLLWWLSAWSGDYSHYKAPYSFVAGFYYYTFTVPAGVITRLTPFPVIN